MRRTDDMSIWPWPLILKVTAIVGHTHLGTLSQYQVQILRYGPHGSDIPCDLVTITFNLGGHGACRWCGSTSSICTSTLKFLGLTVRKTWHILCVCVSRPVTLTFDLETGAQCGTLLPILVILQLFVFDLWAIGPTRLRLITWPCDLELWPWRSWRLWLMRVVVLHPCIKFEVRRLCHSEDMAHDVCHH